MDNQITFPALGFWTSKARPGWPERECFRGFDEGSQLHLASQRELRFGERIGLLLVDSAARTWAVRKVWSTGFRTPLWSRALLTVFNDRDSIEHEVQHEFEDRGLTPFSEVQERVCSAIEQNPDDWRDDEVLAGEAGPPIRLEDVLTSLMAAVRRAATVQEIFDSLDLDRIYPALQAAAALEYERGDN